MTPVSGIAAVRPVGQARITDGLWRQWQQLDRSVTLGEAVRQLEAQFSTPSLSSTSPDHDWMVDIAPDLLVAKINESARPGTEVVAPYRLVARESTAETTMPHQMSPGGRLFEWSHRR